MLLISAMSIGLVGAIMGRPSTSVTLLPCVDHMGLTLQDSAVKMTVAQHACRREHRAT